uniref:Uncharacterized protein n=1 Tax=Rhizophora mucronata TaxID=61149 RepID=A0A2P2PQP0_RHIMU
MTICKDTRRCNSKWITIVLRGIKSMIISMGLIQIWLRRYRYLGITVIRMPISDHGLIIKTCISSNSLI